MNLFIFTHAPKQNSPPGFYHYPPERWELPVPAEQDFLEIIFPENGGGCGGGIMELKKIPKLTKVSFLVYVFVVQ